MAIKRYGIPYAMSKNRIAKAIIDFLPPADTFVDLYAGGCAVAHAALESGKYEHVVINDLDPMPTQMFVDAAAGKFNDERRVIDRQTYYALKKKDPYVRYCWSYGSKGTSYIYGIKNEPLKLAACRMIFNPQTRDEFQAAAGILIETSALDEILEPEDWRERLRRFTRYAGRTESLNRLERLSPLHNLAYITTLKSRLNLGDVTRFVADYRDVPIPENSVVYCDIPYKDVGIVREMGMQGFNHDEFYAWARERKNLYISSYEMPEEGFKVVYEIRRSAILHKNGWGTAVEKIFIPK